MNMPSADDILAMRESGEFDPDWYISRYPDVASLGIDPFEHYLLIGSKIGRLPSAKHGPAMASATQAPGVGARFHRFGVIEHNPLISIIIVSFNSGSDLKALFPTVAKQSYRNFEVILIENGDQDTRPLLETHFDNFQYFQSDNVGFAEANNIGVRASKGELLALINPDTRLADDALQNLLDALRYDETAAVAVPKISFFERFVRLKMSADGRFSIRREELLRGLAYKKLFVRSGSEKDGVISSEGDGMLSVDVPYEAERTIDLELQPVDGLARCEVRLGYSTPKYFTWDDGNNPTVQISLNDENCSSARYLVNNAGSSLHSDGSPYDRGFAQFDDGAFFAKCYVEALCGCAALIRRSAVLEREIFAAPFFAYYEDSELSHWLGERGSRILYQPEAQVFHRHSESTEESSLQWNVLVRRSKSLYDSMTGATPLPLKLFHFNYPDEFTGPVRLKLEELDEQVRKSAGPRDLVRPMRRTACVYNTYFSSMGGGEKHALDVASMLSDDYDVYLLSETDFEISALEQYFSVDLSTARKLVSTNVDTWLTSKFDLFVNSTFRSNLISRAAENLYIVSFPHADIDRDVIAHYRFLHNSPFTAGWARKFWGEHRSETVLPILGDYKSLHLDIHKDTKKTDIISVGRFTYDGHCKNHHYVLDAYKRLVDHRPELAKWRLRILGSCDYAQPSAIEYLRDLKEAAKGYNIDILPNVAREALDAAYTDAAIYVHATGLSVSGDKPELHEHFGITTFEALAHGCLPVVYRLGGPAAQVEALPQARLFGDRLELQHALEAAIADWESNRIRPDEIQEYARAIHAKNEQFAQTLLAGIGSNASVGQGATGMRI